MNKFFIYTRGRTGSSAIADELNTHSNCVCHSELFRREPLGDPVAREQYERLGVDYIKGRIDKGIVVPFGMWELLSSQNVGDYQNYLQFMLDDAERRGKTVVGFKFLHNQSIERRGLIDVLRREGYVAVHLIRRNVVRQVLSGMLARKRGFYNSKSREAPDEKYDVDIPEFVATIKQNKKDIAAVKKQLASSGLEHFEIYYEDYLSDRAKFFDFVLPKLNLSTEQLKPSGFKVMVPSDLSKVVNNYDALKAAVDKMGLSDMLMSH